MRKITTLVFVCCAALSTAIPAVAAVSIPTGVYIETNLGASKISGLTSPGTVSSSGKGMNFDIGYKFMPFFAAEIGYTKYADSKLNNTAGIKAAKGTHSALDIAGKAILPITNSGFELFGKLGVAKITTDIKITNEAAASGENFNTGSHKSTSAYLAAGGDYAFTPHASAHLEWARANGNRSTGRLDLYSIGLSYIFG